MAPSKSQPSQAGSDGRAGYVERLHTPWWWYLAGVAVALLLAGEISVVLPGWWGWIPVLVLVPLTALLVRRMSSGRIAVAGGSVRAGDHEVPVADVEQAIDLSAVEVRRLVGRHGDPSAFTFVRSWVGPGVQLVLRPAAERTPASPDVVDPAPGTPDDRYPEPYWVLSTRHPDRVRAALHAATAPSAG
jgi:hypothetical protein